MIASTNRQVALVLLQFPAAVSCCRFARGAGQCRAGLGAVAGRACLAGLRTGALPRPLAIAALAAAGVTALAPLVLALSLAAMVIPAGRFPSFVIMGITGFPLARGSGGS